MKSSKTIVITGCTRGLGLALTERFCERGHTVFGCGRSATLIERMSEQFTHRAHFSTVDVSVESEVHNWAVHTLDNMEAPDILINNAGVINIPAPLWKIPASDVQQLMGINFMGTVHVIQAFLPAMMNYKCGVIVNMSSGWGRSTSPEVAPYCASKWAIEGLSQSLAQELPEPLSCVALNPGIIDTELLRNVWAEEAEAYEDPDSWSGSAASLILKLGHDDNGKSLTCL